MRKYLVLVCLLMDLSLAEKAGDLPNIIFMMADDLGFGDVHYNGGVADTPNLDAMARGPNSVRLNRYYSGGCVCSPTRGSVLTGRNPNRYCIWHANRQEGCHDFACSMLMPLPTSEITVAEILQEHGYRTAAFGKWHVGDLHPCPYQYSNKKWPVGHPGVHGFDTWWVTIDVAPTATPNCGCFAHAHCEGGHYSSHYKPSCRNYYSIDDYTGDLKSYPNSVPGDDSHFLYQLLHEFLDNVNGSGKPFFAYLPFHTVHSPYIALSGMRHRYTSRGYDARKADYYGSITAMDEAVGLTRQLLDQYGIRHNTMLWFTSDNGPAPGQPGSTGGFRGLKGSLYEGGVRVPGIIEWPAVISENLQSDFPVVSSDLLPTVCDILGVSPPLDREIDGESILPFLQGQTSLRNKSIGWAWYIHGKFEGNTYNITYSGNQYKLFVNRYDMKKNEMKNIELFDLVNDPHETTDISGDHQELLASMKQEALEWIQSVKYSATEEVGCVGYSISSQCHGCHGDFKHFLPVCDPK